MKRSHRAYDTVKRVADVVASAALLVVLSPVLALIAILVRTSLGPPVLFVQRRVGFEERIFAMYKFRTMRDSAPDASLAERTASDAQRVTRLGRVLRSTSLDELPQLWNILRGDMSLIGPRPLLPEYLPRYSATQARRHEVRPGLTGWAQVTGRNAVSWDERLDADVWYVDNRSFALDIKIVWLSAKVLATRAGADTDDGTSMPPFDPKGS